MADPYFYFDTGTPRHVVGHMVSGGLANALVFAVMSQMDNQDSATVGKVALKRGLQGALATGVAVDVANILGDPQRNNLDALFSLAAGATGIYLIEKGIKDGEKE